MRKKVSIRGLVFAAILCLAATIGAKMLPSPDYQIGWLSLFAAALTLFFGSMPADEPRTRRRERE